MAIMGVGVPAEDSNTSINNRSSTSVLDGACVTGGKSNLRSGMSSRMGLSSVAIAPPFAIAASSLDNLESGKAIYPDRKVVRVTKAEL